MNISRQTFGKTNNGEKAERFTLTNHKGSAVRITNYGGIITDIIVPDREGRMDNIVAGFSSLDAYISDHYRSVKPYFGAIIGRYANRISQGGFVIDGEQFHTPANLGEVTLHGGRSGFDTKLWQAQTEIADHEVALTLSYLSPHLEEGFPGNLQVTVIYRWNDLDELIIDYHAETDRKTHINLTNHAYFNLNGFKGDIQDHHIALFADRITEVGAHSIPTGNLAKVSATRYDLRTPVRIGDRIHAFEGIGFDHNYVLNGSEGNLTLAAVVREETSGRRLDVLTSEPGLQFYTANWLDGSLTRDDVVYGKWSAFCLETQHFPDSPNQPSFPTTLLLPGEVFTSRTVYKFGLA